MDNECKVLMDAAVHADAGEKGQKASSKFTVALVTFTLCLAAAAAVLCLNGQTKDSRRDEDNFDLRHTLRQISNVRAAIHLEGYHNPQMNSVEWRSKVDQSHSVGGLVLENNEIRVPRDGLYFVYSQASFAVSCNADADDDNPQSLVHLSHMVQRSSSTYGYNNKTYTTILHSIRTVCQTADGSDAGQAGRWYSAVYMGAVFRLSEGDRLRTKTEEKLLPSLEDEQGKTFFGVFAL